MTLTDVGRTNPLQAAPIPTLSAPDGAGVEKAQRTRKTFASFLLYS